MPGTWPFCVNGHASSGLRNARRGSGFEFAASVKFARRFDDDRSRADVGYFWTLAFALELEKESRAEFCLEAPFGDAEATGGAGSGEVGHVAFRRLIGRDRHSYTDFQPFGNFDLH